MGAPQRLILSGEITMNANFVPQAYFIMGQSDTSLSLPRLFSDKTYMQGGVIQRVNVCLEDCFHGLDDCKSDGVLNMRMRKFIGEWALLASTGIGYHSIAPGKPAAMLGRVDILCREATDDEVYFDFSRYGEQVIGLRLEEAMELGIPPGPIIDVKGKKFLYSGPLRLVALAMTAHGFQGGMPSNMQNLLAGLEEHAPSGDHVFCKSHYLFRAEEGSLYHHVFLRDDMFNPCKAMNFGSIAVDSAGSVRFRDFAGNSIEMTRYLRGVDFST